MEVLRLRYEYFAKLDRVVDGDTVDMFVDLGLNTWSHQRFRLKGINAPEMREKPQGQDAKETLKALIDLHKAPKTGELIVKTHKDKRGKYGRFVATLISIDGQTDLNLKMVELGHAELVEY